MLRGLVLGLGLLSCFCGCVAGASFDYYGGGALTVGIFNNLTGAEVDGLVLRFAGPLTPEDAVGVGADMQLESNVEGELRSSGVVQPNGSWEVDWPSEGPRLEYAAWLLKGAVVEDIAVHSPTAAFSMILQDESVSFSAAGSGDPDGFPLARYLWRWSDGMETEGASVTRSFARGDYQVTLTVWDVDGNEGSRTSGFGVNPHYTLTVSVVGNGRVDMVPSQAEYSYGDTVTLTPASNDLLFWYFKRWEADLSGTASPATITITGDMTVTAVFVQRILFSLVIVDYDDGGCATCGSVTITGGLNETTTSAISFVSLDYGTQLTLEETPNTSEGWSFEFWDFHPSAATSGWNPITFRVTQNLVVYVVFRR